jgi:hypothetical protein
MFSFNYSIRSYNYSLFYLAKSTYLIVSLISTTLLFNINVFNSVLNIGTFCFTERSLLCLVIRWISSVSRTLTELASSSTFCSLECLLTACFSAIPESLLSSLARRFRVSRVLFLARPLENSTQPRSPMKLLERSRC